MKMKTTSIGSLERATNVEKSAIVDSSVQRGLLERARPKEKGKMAKAKVKERVEKVKGKMEREWVISILERNVR